MGALREDAYQRLSDRRRACSRRVGCEREAGTHIEPWCRGTTTRWRFHPVCWVHRHWTLGPNGWQGLRARWLCCQRPHPPPGHLLPGEEGGGGPVVKTSGALEVALAPTWGTALSAALVVSTGRGIHRDPLPNDAHSPEFDAKPNEVLSKSKGVFGVFRRSMLLVGLPGSAGGSCIPCAVCRLGLIDVAPGTPCQLRAQVNHVVCNLALQLHGPRDFAHFSSP